MLQYTSFLLSLALLGLHSPLVTSDLSTCGYSSGEPCGTIGEYRCYYGGFQVCAYSDNNGDLAWSSIEPCNAGTTCFPTSSGSVVCGPIGVTDNQCTLNNSQCYNSTAIQTCVSYAQGTTWSSPQFCAAGQTCQNGACADNSPSTPATPTGVCTPGYQQCVNATAYRSCANQPDGSGGWEQPQPCAKATICQVYKDNYVNCANV